MSETVYIETSILGYLTARLSRDLVVAANIEITREWWDLRRNAFQLYSSQAVIKETSQGDTEIASRRLKIIRNLALLDLNQSVLDLAEQFWNAVAFLQKLMLMLFILQPQLFTAWITYSHGTVSTLPMLKFKENWQRLVLIWDTSCRFFVHPMNFLEINYVSRCDCRRNSQNS